MTNLPKPKAFLLLVIILTIGTWATLIFLNDKQVGEYVANSSKAKPVTKDDSDLIHRQQPQLTENFARVISSKAGEDHILAQELLMEWSRERQMLNSEDQARLLAYLQQGQPKDMPDGDWEERVNEVLNVLRAQTNEVKGLVDLMLHIAVHDTNPVLRMYAMQHIYLRIPDEPSEDRREMMIAYLWSVAVSPDDIHSGAAVMFLNDLKLSEGDKVQSIDAELISRAALRLLDNAEINPASRISALHTCSERRIKEALPLARRIAQDELQIIPLRKAAIHCIGKIGDSEDFMLLESLGASNTALQAATKPAINDLME